MKKNIRVSLVSNVNLLGDPLHNLAKMEKTIIETQILGIPTDIFIFSEIGISGGFYPGGLQANSDNYKKNAEQIPDGPSCREIARMAKENQTIICAGIIEKSGSNFSISHVVFGPNGFMQKQRKIFPQNPHKCKFFTPGKLINTFDLLGHKCAILACADWLEAETTVIAGLEEVAIILAPTGGFDTEMFPTLRNLMWAKALQTNSYILASFTHNNSDKSEIAGALAFAPDGKELIYATRLVGVEMIHSLEVYPQKPNKRWGGFESRVDFLNNSLNSYFSRQDGTLRNEYIEQDNKQFRIG